MDLKGNTLMPSFIDPHSHMTSVAYSFLRVQLDEITSIKEIKEKSESELENAEILSRDTVMTNENGVLSLKVYVECILDIAEEIKIDT